MRIARFSHGGEVSYGLVLHQDTAPAEGHGAGHGVGDGQFMLAQLAGHPFGGSADDIKLTGVRFALDQVRLLAPILPSKVVPGGIPVVSVKTLTLPRSSRHHPAAKGHKTHKKK